MPAALQSALGVVSNHVLRDRLEGVRVAVQAGAGLADRLQAAGLFPDLAVQMVRIGEATGQPDRMLVQLAEILDQDLRRDLSRALSLLVPLLTIVLGVMVAGIVASVMLAVLSINDLAQ
jgi:general secretion pathway protein F